MRSIIYFKLFNNHNFNFYINKMDMVANFEQPSYDDFAKDLEVMI